MEANAHNHEILKLFARRLHPLSAKLTDMLNEHFLHQTERRGCGYTQATRVMAEFINEPRSDQDFEDLRLFADYSVSGLKTIVQQAAAHQLELPQGWRNLDQNPQISALLAQHPNPRDAYENYLKQEVAFQGILRSLHNEVELEESKLLCALIEDIVLPKDATALGLSSIRQLEEKPKVGSCPMAEKFFLEIAHRKLLRLGEINIFVDSNNQPLLLEKMNMGDNHSCINLVPVMMNGVRLPPGCLFSTDYDIDTLPKTANKQLKGWVIPLDACPGFWFLRVTTLAVSPKNRARAFSTHFQQQVKNGLFSPESVMMSQLLTVAQEQV